MAETFTFTIKPITDLSDVKANVGEIQKAFSKLKLPDKIGEGLNKNIKNFFTEFEKYESKVKEGIKTSGDYRQVENSLNKINSLYSEIVKDIQTVSKGDLSEVFDLDSGEFKEVGDQIKEIVRQLNNIKIDPNKVTGPIDKLKSLIKNDKVSGKEGILNNLIGHIEKGNLDEAKNALSDLEKYIKKVSLPEGQTGRVVGKMTRQHSDDAKVALAQIQQVFTEAQNKGLPLEQTLTTLRQRFQDIQNSSANSLRDFTKQADDSVEATESLVGALQKAHKEDFNFDNQVKAIDRQIQSYFGLGQMLRKVGNIAREAFKTIQELDKAMTETAVVTNFSVGDMWEKLPLYTAEANKLGSTIKDVYEATTLYYQQGLNTNQSMGLAVETLKMARIAGMDAKDATDAMTAALRGFNMELNQVSAQRINDVYSELAAITASDTQEISTAMEKVASLAHNAGMELETTSAFLAQMIETTREAPENLGTALKTVVARFQEMKQDPTKLIDSEGVMLDANKVDKALKSIGVNLLNTNGEFRKLDDVFLEIASRWDTLSMGQQRYIATMAAGSRQQSRFIAMMSNYSRTMELVDAAYNSSGASQRQFEKTLESLDAKLNKLKNAWNEFAMGLMNDELLKGGIDLLTSFIDKVNEFVDFIGNIPPDPFKGITKSLTTLILTLGGLGAARKILSRGIESGVGWFKGDMSGKAAITNLFFSPKNAIKEAQAEKTAAEKAGKEAGTAFSIAYTNARDSILKNKPLPYSPQPPASTDLSNKFRAAANQEYDEDNPFQFSKEQQESLNEQADYFEEDIPKYGQSLGMLANKFYSAGAACQAFGSILQGTPLAPIGKAISALGIGLQAFGGIAAKTAKIYGASIAEAGVESTVGFTAMKVGLKGVAKAALEAIVPLLPFVAVAIAIAGAAFLIYRAITKDKREMKTLAEAAKASSDAFDNLKTSTEELKNSINDIRNSDDLFKGLVVGTTEWNLALVEANQQILDLIKKYPMLQKYMTTDVNGRMSISEAGFKAVQEEQNKKLGQAQALDILTNAEHNSKLLEQEQKKIFKDEKITNTVAVTYEFDENGASTMHTELVKSYDQLSEEGQQEWDSIQAKIDTESAAAREQAVRAALSANGELNNTIISLFGQNLEEVEKQFEGETNLDTIKYAYAEFIGGVYDPLTKALTDASGEDVNLSDDALKQIYPQIMALLQFQEQAPEVESAVKSLGKSFDSLFGDRKGSNFINDLLDNNLEIDLSQLEQFRNMEVDEIVDILGDSGDELAKVILQNENASATDLANQLKENAKNLSEIQTQSYRDVAVWYAKSVKKYNAEAASHSGKTLSKAVLEGLTAGSADAINKFMSDISQSFDAITVSTMGENLFSAILGQPSDIQASITELLGEIDWTSAIERGNFYAQYEEGSKAFKELNDQQKKFVTGQKKVDKSLDLTGKQFEELVQSSDFLEILTEKWSDFADESGKVDATGIREMAKECGTLSKVLNLAEFDADNLAMALNYFQKTGSFDGITGAVIAAAKEFNSLDKLIDDVKQDVEGFKPGENYDQGMDAYRGYMKSLKEGYENRQYSDADTLSYAHRFINSSEWKEFAKAHGGSNKSAEKEIIDSLETIFTENEEDTTINILDRLASGKTLLGGEAKESDVFSAYYNDEGQLKLDIDPTTTREAFIKALVDERGFTEEMARAFTLSLEGQDWGFIDDNLTDAFNKAGRDSGIAEYIKGIQGRGLIPENGTPQGNVVISESEIAALQEMGGYESLDDVVADIESSLGVLPGTIQRFNAETETAANYLQKLYGSNANAQDSAKDFLEVSQNGIGNFNSATEKLQQSGIDATTALNMAIDMAHQAGVEQVQWGKDLINVSDIINGEQFNEAVEALEEEGHWQDVGKILGDAVANALAEAGIGNGAQSDDSEASGNDKSSNFTVPDIKAEITSQFSTDKIQSQINEATRGITANFEAGLEVDKTNAFERINEVKQEAEKKVITPVDADTKDAITKDGILVSEIEKEVTKQVTADTTPAQTAVDELDQRASQPVFKTINATITGLTQKLKSFFGLAKGQNNYISPSGFYTGSAAKGVKGTLGPNGKGGLTLTGEEGFEIAWLPSEGRAMILGAAGPQMTNLPSDAVVYTHEQSKKIVKQKGISTGSAYGGTYDSPSGAINVNIVGDETSGSGSGSGSSSSSKEKDLKRTNWYKEEITRYNLNQSINQITAEIEKTTKSIEKSLDKLGTKYSDIAKDVGEQANLIQQNIENQKKLRDSFQAQLNLLDNGGRSLWMDIIDSAGESSQKSISTGQFVYKDKDGSYAVDKNKVLSYAASLGGDAETQKVNAETIFNTINSELNNLTSGLLSATKAIEDGKEELQNLIKQVQDAFYAWENELTKIYDLNQQLENSDIRRNRLASENSMLLAQISAGFNSAADAAERLQAIERDDAKLIRERISLLKDDIKAKQEQLKQLASSADEESDWAKYNWNNQQTLKAGGTLSINDIAQEQQAADKYLAARYIEAFTKITRNADNSITLDFNEKALENERLNGNISEATYNAIKEGFDALQEANEDLQQTIIDASDFMTELYEEYNKHIQTLAELEKDLIDAFVEAAQREVNKLEALNSALTNAAKAVLDQVKKNIDARRKSEDNAKTEGDIAQKQARLAVLRANTGGGNQVEIAQLEKEISDAQRSYGRTLEDQLMANMQSQADEASKQRQEQIDLAKQQIEYNKQIGLYASMADDLLKDGNLNIVAIEETLKITRQDGIGYYNEILEGTKLQSQIAEAVSASQGLDELADILGVTGDDVKSIGEELAELITTWNTQMMKQEEVISTGTGGSSSVKSPTVSSNPEPKTSTNSSSNSKSSTTKKDYSSGWLATLPETNSNYFSSAQVQTLQHGLNTMKWSGLISFGADLAIDGVIGPKTTAAIKALQKLVGTTQDGIWGPQTGAATHKKYPKYARGGLANKTGPAWLDGTPTKPELVLNAQDTKNFIALKDILSGVMRSISHTDTSNIYNSPTNFEINVNVEKIASDYDVDKLTERIKRNIVKDATYRNVTAVRNFR